MANKLCRLCIGKKEYMISLFDKDKEFPKKAKICLNLEVKKFSICGFFFVSYIHSFLGMSYRFERKRIFYREISVMNVSGIWTCVINSTINVIMQIQHSGKRIVRVRTLL